VRVHRVGMRLSGPVRWGQSFKGNSSGRLPLRRASTAAARRLAAHAGARWTAAQPGKLFDRVDAKLFPHDDQDLGSLPQGLPEAAEPPGRQLLAMVSPVELDQVEGDQPQGNRQVGGFFALGPLVLTTASSAPSERARSTARWLCRRSRNGTRRTSLRRLFRRHE